MSFKDGDEYRVDMGVRHYVHSLSDENGTGFDLSSKDTPQTRYS
jgi:hypothetical protein